jgi:alkanesulfonate monooxygenase SsuD/methylene tetrahydromethanopterin reductase-like flavin-dependent oxidoreductase (luciferase family)
MLSTGVGAYLDDFDALRPTKPRPHRGEITDEGLSVMRLLLDEQVVTFEGKHFAYRDLELYPKPVQAHLPIWVAGNHVAVVRRAAEYGDVWYPACLPPEKLADRIKILREHMTKIARPLKEVEVRPQVFICIGRNRKEARERFRDSTFFRHLESIEGGLIDPDGSLEHWEEGNLIGPPEYLVERLEEYRAAGVKDWGGQIFVADTVPELLEVMTIYADEVMAKVP